MYIDVVPNRNSCPTTLLREGWREGKKTFVRTISNITHWPDPKIKAFRALLKGKTLVATDELFTIEKTIPHGHVEAVLGTLKKLKLDTIISSKPCSINIPNYLLCKKRHLNYSVCSHAVENEI